MRKRYFATSGLVLVALGLALFFASPGLALRSAIVNQLFGQKLIRADVLEKNGDWRIDRGVVTSVDSSQVTLREADGRIQSIPLSTFTRVAFQGRRLSVGALASHWRVIVTWPASGTAQSVDVERIPHARSGQGVG